FSTYSREQYDRAPAFFATTPNPTEGGHPGASIFEGEGPGRCGCSVANNYAFGFGPRIGVAYQINPKTVLRGGVGVTYAPYRGVWWRSNSLTNLNIYSQDFLKSQYGLDISNPADRVILGAQVQSSGAKQFQNRLPYTGFSGGNSVAQSLRPFPQFGNLS